MNSRFMQLKVLILLLLASVCIIIWLSLMRSQVSELTVRFLDVGQGDAIHIVTPDGFEVLVDGGSSATVLRQLAINRPFFDRSIDLVVATHPDTDHVGGLVDVLERYEVSYILMTEVEHEATAARAFDAAAETEPGVSLVYAEAGQLIRLGASTTLTVLSPPGGVTNWQSNNASIVLQLTYGNIDFMFTGDAPSTVEDYLVKVHAEMLDSEVLKLGHHGSKTSTGENFLEAVSPEFAVISAGRGNRYGHPAEEVMNRVVAFGAQTFSTAELGTITFKTDGARVWVE